MGFIGTGYVMRIKGYLHIEKSETFRWPWIKLLQLGMPAGCGCRPALGIGRWRPINRYGLPGAFYKVAAGCTGMPSLHDYPY